MDNRHDAHEDVKRAIAKRIEELLNKTGVSARYLAQVCGISYGAMVKMLRKENLPRLEALFAIADYFAVPLDFICGRCDEKTAKAILEDYPKHFMELRRASYEYDAYSGTRRKYSTKHLNGDPKYRDLPWPYNVLNLVRDKKAQDKVGEDQVEMLLSAIETLKPREKKVILDYYRDGKTLIQIGEENEISKQFVWAIAKRGIKRLKALYQGFIV